MKKILVLVLALVMALSAVSALADITIVQNKVEIDAALQEYAAAYTEKTGKTVKVITSGGSSDYNTALKAEFASGKEPDIFVFEGPTGYELYKDKIADMTGAEWTQYTGAAYIVDGKVVGFPVAVEGYGLAYNADILAKAEIDPATLTNVDALSAAFEKLDSMKDELGLKCVISMVAGTAQNMTWVTGLHNFSVYLGCGLERGDTSIIDLVMEKGEVDEERFHEYCEYVALIFKYSDPEMLLNGTQDMQLAAFANGETAFYHQGNWMDPNIAALGVEFPMGYVPHAFSHKDTDGIMVDAPSWYAVNSTTGNAEEAIEFLNAMVTSEEGHDYMVNKAGMVPAFTNVTLQPTGPLSKAIMEWNAAGKTYSWQQYKLPDGFGMRTLGAIYELLASGAIDEPTFEQMVKDAIATCPTL